MQKTTIEWTDRTWNPVTGCTKVSQGCKNCYAERIYERFKSKGAFKLVHLHPERLMAPRGWKKPSMVFVNSMSDLFHEAVPFDFINSVFLTMLRWAPQHTYQVLTKRPERMLEYFDYISRADDVMHEYLKRYKKIWFGVSVEDQQTANERIPLLLQLPVPVRFLSCEPLLGPVDFIKPIGMAAGLNETFTPALELQWVICGGESGPRARPMHPGWARGLRDQCNDSHIPFFFKQWGQWLPFELDTPPDWYNAATGCSYDGHGMCFTDELGNPGRWNGGRWMDGCDALPYCMDTEDEQCMFLSVGKKKAGHLLDGEVHQQFPNLNK